MENSASCKVWIGVQSDLSILQSVRSQSHLVFRSTIFEAVKPVWREGEKSFFFFLLACTAFSPSSMVYCSLVIWYIRVNWLEREAWIKDSGSRGGQCILSMPKKRIEKRNDFVSRRQGPDW